MRWEGNNLKKKVIGLSVRECVQRVRRGAGGLCQLIRKIKKKPKQTKVKPGPAMAKRAEQRVRTRTEEGPAILI